MAGAFYGRSGIDFRNTIPDGVERLKGKLRANMIRAVEEAGELVRSRAYDNANVKTGHMRENIETHVVEHNGIVEARVGVDLAVVPYAHHQEFGPHGNAFLRRAFDESRAECHEIMRSALDDTAIEDSSTLVRFVRGRKPSGSEE